MVTIVGSIFLIPHKEKNFDVRGFWIIKESPAIPLKYSNNIIVSNVIFHGTLKIGEMSTSEKNFFSLFSKTYYSIDNSKIEITGKLDEYRRVVLSGKFLNENNMKGTWYYYSNIIANNTGYWEATRVLNEKDQTVNRKKSK